MSYDLSFGVSRGQQPLTLEQFLSHFRDRPCITLNDAQAWYENEDTGVYFSFEYEPELEAPEDWADYQDEGEEEEAWVPSIASFNINFNRPSYFALEAAPEIDAFSDAFSLPVDDPQQDDAGDRQFDQAAFIKSWQKSNAWACRAMRSGPGSVVSTNVTYPGSRLRAAWEWNYKRNLLQSEWGERLFVPKINFASTTGGVKSFVVWGDAIPCLLPTVDLVVFVRDELAPKRLFRKSEKEVVLAPYGEISRNLAAFPVREGPLKYIELAYDESPSDVVKVVTSQRTTPEEIQFQGLPPDQVLDEELVVSEEPSA